jgi:hypothetical protein
MKESSIGYTVNSFSQSERSKMKRIHYLFLTLLLTGFSIIGCTDYNKTIYGTWKFNKEKSTDIVTWRYRQPQLVISNGGEAGVSIVYHWLERNKIAMVDSIKFNPGGDRVEIPVTSQYWLENWYMGVLAKKGTIKTVSGEWKKQYRELQVQEQQTVETSQGDAQIQITYSYNLDRRGDVLTVFEKRSSRPTPIKLVFERVAASKSE